MGDLLPAAAMLNAAVAAAMLLVANMASLSRALPRGSHTPLVNKDIPCAAENLKESDHYICSSDKTIICLPGWSDPEKLCRTPVCQFVEMNENDIKKGCGQHGDCVRPNVCACAVGWEGLACDECVPLPGCQDGRCVNALECVCNKYDEEGAITDDEATGKNRFTGSRCDIPVCMEGCDHGRCNQPGECICDIGWKGQQCDKCITLPGCKRGQCNRPFGCECEEGWVGRLCDCPQCKKGCDMKHGYCVNEGTTTEECLCHPGWKGHNCSEEIEGGNSRAGLSSYYHHEMSASCKIYNQRISNGTESKELTDCMKGCAHGTCNESNKCICGAGWDGEKCDVCTWLPLMPCH